MELSQNRVEWTDLMQAYYGLSLSKVEQSIWSKELMDNEHGINTTNTELCEAIRARINDPEDKFKGKPTLKDLRIWVFRLRKKRRGNRFNPSDERFVDQLWFDIKRAYNVIGLVEAWSLICDPEAAGYTRSTKIKECEELEKRAKDYFKDWRRPTEKEIAGDGPTFAEVLGRMVKKHKARLEEYDEPF